MANKYANLDGSKKIKDEYGKINIGFDKVEEDLKNIIVTPAEGVSEQEIIQARKGENTLNDRLNVTDNKVDTTKDNLNTRIDNIIATPTTVSQQEIIDARQSKASLGANLTAIKDDLVAHKEDYATLKNVNQGSIPYFKTDFVLSGLNLFDSTKITQDKYIAHGSGTMMTYAGYITSDFIPVKAGQIYSISRFNKLIFYDKQQNFLSGRDHSNLMDYSFTAEQTGYIRTCYQPNDQGNIRIVEGNNLPSQATFEYQIPKLSFTESQRNYLISNKKYDGLKWAVMGDSLTEENIRTTKHYHTYISEELGLEVSNMGQSGSGYKAKDISDNAFYQRILNIPLDTDVVTIFGSSNDMSGSVPLGTANDTGTDTLGGCINTTIDNLYSVLPTVALGIIAPVPYNSNKPSDETIKMTQYARLIGEICQKRGIPFLNLYFSSGLRPWDIDYRTLMYSRDEGGGTHPDENGHKLIAPQIREFILSLI